MGGQEPTYCSVPTHVARRFGARRAWLTTLSRDELLAFLRRTYGEVLDTAPLARRPVQCLDLRACGARARQERWLLVVDLSSCGPDACPAVRLGAHVAICDLDEGHLLVAVAQDLPFETHETGGLSASLSAMVEARLEALARRWHTQSDAAQVVASYLRCHPCVADLRYPGLKSDPSFEVASRTLQGGFGPLVDYRVVGTHDWRRICCNEEDPRDQVMTLERLLAKS